jgi:DNA-binding response OmpR family regulator
MRLMIVDDNMDLASALRDLLEAEGHDIHLAGNSLEGYDTYRLFRPDLVITDLNMPGPTGIDLIHRIRAFDPQVRVIYMSGEMSRFQPLLEREKREHSATFLRKPFSRRQLFELLPAHT